MTGPLLFVAADPRECIQWTGHWEERREIRLPVHWAKAGRWKGREVIAIANGAGAERAYQAVKSVDSPAAVCSIGFCGALDSTLRVGDVVQAYEVRFGPAQAKVRCESPVTRQVVVESVDHIVSTADEKRTLRDGGASVVEMEAAGVARAAAELCIPFYCVRVVSDLADETFANDFEAALLPDGRFSLRRLLIGAMWQPVERFAELIRLGRRTALASKNLGDFLANCSF